MRLIWESHDKSEIMNTIIQLTVIESARLSGVNIKRRSVIPNNLIRRPFV